MALANAGILCSSSLAGARLLPEPALGVSKRRPASTSWWSSKSNNSATVLLRSPPTPASAAAAVSPPMTATPHMPAPVAPVLNRKDFPADFFFGAATSAYQVEGGRNEDGKKDSIWDTFCDKYPGRIIGQSNGSIACDSYHRYMDDVKLLAHMGVNSYRFSISWSRILPNGTLKGGKNQAGIDYYNNLINALISHGITPFVTLFHWDTPQALEDEYNGFLSKNIVSDFKDFAEVCFQEFGDRVRHWITLNEPWSFSILGYGLGWLAPGRCSVSTTGIVCDAGDSSTEPYVVGHNLLLAHAAAANLYKSTYQSAQKGKIGITNNSYWFKPYDDEYESSQAVARSFDFMLGWFCDPVVKGDYPFNMKAVLGRRLPAFTDDEKKAIKGSYDFIGINYYSSIFVQAAPYMAGVVPYLSVQDSYANQMDKNLEGQYPGGQTEKDSWIYDSPEGLKQLLLTVNWRYDNPEIYVTENGVYNLDDPSKNVYDPMRVKFYEDHLYALKQTIDEGVKVKGFFPWALIDNFEWEKGYGQRYGLNYVDYNTLDRSPKASAVWYKSFLAAAAAGGRHAHNAAAVDNRRMQGSSILIN